MSKAVKEIIYPETDYKRIKITTKYAVEHCCDKVKVLDKDAQEMYSLRETAEDCDHCSYAYKIWLVLPGLITFMIICTAFVIYFSDDPDAAKIIEWFKTYPFVMWIIGIVCIGSIAFCIIRSIMFSKAYDKYTDELATKHRDYMTKIGEIFNRSCEWAEDEFGEHSYYVSSSLTVDICRHIEGDEGKFCALLNGYSDDEAECIDKYIKSVQQLTALSNVYKDTKHNISLTLNGFFEAKDDNCYYIELGTSIDNTIIDKFNVPYYVGCDDNERYAIIDKMVNKVDGDTLDFRFLDDYLKPVFVKKGE